MDKLRESDLYIEEVGFPSGRRAFIFNSLSSASQLQPIHPLQLLSLDCLASVIADIGTRDRPFAIRLALCRLLVPCLYYRGVGRHLVVEEWNVNDFQGSSLRADTRTELARDLAEEQARDFQLVTTGEKPPSGSLAELFWKAQTDLPLPQECVENADLGRFSEALYFYLVPPGYGIVELETQPQIISLIEKCKASAFSLLNLGITPRKLHRLFKTLLAVAVSWASELTGHVARHLVCQRLRLNDRRDFKPLSEDELAMLNMRYGACHALGNINVSFLFGCGEELAARVNALFLAYANGAPEAERERLREELRRLLFLLGEFQIRRKTARAQERRDDRLHKMDRLPGGPRKQAAKEADPKARDPSVPVELAEELEQLTSFLPKLKLRDAERIKALLEFKGVQLPLPQAAFANGSG